MARAAGKAQETMFVVNRCDGRASIDDTCERLAPLFPNPIVRIKKPMKKLSMAELRPRENREDRELAETKALAGQDGRHRRRLGKTKQIIMRVAPERHQQTSGWTTPAPHRGQNRAGSEQGMRA